MNLRPALFVFVPLLMAAPALAQQFGEPLSLTEATGISDILADPSAFEGELVQVKGTVVDVCPRAGCYVVIGEGKEGGGGRQITFKVDDGAMVFKPALKGREITAEGIVVLAPPAPAPEAAEEACGGCEGEGGCCENEKPAEAKPAKPAAAPKPAARLNGVGAAVK
jgi:hypothetical protein